MARFSLHQLLVSERDAGYFGTTERKYQEREITVEAGMGTDRKTHAWNSFFRNFSMLSPLSTASFPVNFCILNFLFPSQEIRYLYMETVFGTSGLLVINNYSLVLQQHFTLFNFLAAPKSMSDR